MMVVVWAALGTCVKSGEAAERRGADPSIHLICLGART